MYLVTVFATAEPWSKAFECIHVMYSKLSSKCHWCVTSSHVAMMVNIWSVAMFRGKYATLHQDTCHKCAVDALEVCLRSA